MHNLHSMLMNVEKPSRYTGGEHNSVIKNPGEVDVRFCLAFPDIYEVGMSHLGSRIIYGLANTDQNTYCERCFAPWVDMEKELRENDVELFSLETQTPLKQFDILGFSLLYEMSYTNILNMLDMAKIPARFENRTKDMPLVVFGGPCAINPEPIAPFADFILIGDGEETILTMLKEVREWKKSGEEKIELLKKLANIEGFYIPSFYNTTYNPDGTIKEIVASQGAPEKVVRSIVQNLDQAYFPTNIIVPYIGIVHDRVTLELFRGCTRGCRFCQAGFIYRPIRERNLATLQEQACTSIRNTGYEEMSLSSLSSGDYSELGGLIDNLMGELASERVSFSLPSLRIDSFSKSYAQKMQEVRKSTLTFAPEAGTQRLRDVINKGVTEQDLIRSVTDAFESGWNAVKLYFMIGLPTETDEDLDGIADLANKVVIAYKSIPKEKRQKGLRVAVSVASFVPKPCTPFAWEKQDTIEELQRKQRYLRDKFTGMRGIEYNYHSPKLSSLEAAFSRGDRRLADVIEAAFESGCRFDSWNDHFKYDNWMQAFEKCNLDKAFYSYRERGEEEITPYEHIDSRVKKQYLLNERHKAHSADTTQDCREGCNACFDADSLNKYCKGLCK